MTIVESVCKPELRLEKKIRTPPLWVFVNSFPGEKLWGPALYVMSWRFGLGNNKAASAPATRSWSTTAGN